MPNQMHWDNLVLDLWLYTAEIPGSTFFDSESDSESMISFTSIPVPIPSLK